MDTKIENIVIKIELELKKAYKILCVSDGITMKDDLTRYIRKRIGK